MVSSPSDVFSIRENIERPQYAAHGGRNGSGLLRNGFRKGHANQPACATRSTLAFCANDLRWFAAQGNEMPGAGIDAGG
jgi:hypothetical protein